jgi:hypothetical protein
MAKLPRRPTLLLSAALTLAFGACAPGGEPPVDDGGAPADDAGSDDAGAADAGAPDPCADAVLDAHLGTLVAAAGFSVVDSSALGAGPVAVAVTGEGDSPQVYAVDGAALELRDLGTWPSLGDGATLASLLPDGTAADDAFASPFLAADGDRLAAGYTRAFDAVTGLVPGGVLVYDGTLAAAEQVRRIEAEGNYTAAWSGGVLVVNATSAGDANVGAAIYGVVDGEGGLEGHVVAAYDDAWEPYVGYTATTAGEVAAGGFFARGDDAPANHLLRLTADDVEASTDGGPASDLGAAESVGAFALTAVVGWRDGVALIEGDYFNPLEGVRWVDMSDSADRTPTAVLDAVDACTSVDLLASNEDLLYVGVSDANGRRLVRIRDDR